MYSLLSILIGAALLPQIMASYVDTKSLTTNSGYTYIYDFVPATNASKPTLLLLHGYPASRHDWEQQIAALSAEGYGVVAPDMLGFGDSSKPTAVEAYNLKALSKDLTEILDAEGLNKVIGVGHDWGASMLAKLTLWFPQRFTKLVFVTTSFPVPGEFFDIDAVNKAAVDNHVYQPFGYWYFFNSYDAADLIEHHLESYFHGVFTNNASSWGTTFADMGAARAWLNANTTTSLPSWLSAEYKSRWLRIYSQPDIVTSSMNYYKALMRGVQAADEAGLTDEDRALRVPVLAVGSAKDRIVPPEQQRLAIEPWAKAGFEQKIVDAGHWAALEQAEALSAILVDFASS